MCTFLKDSVWDEFDRADVNGRSMAVCKICQRQVAANRGVMCMHFRTQHCNPTDNSRWINPLAGKPLCDKARAFAPQASDRDVCTDVCPQVLQRHLSSKVEDGYTSDVRCGSSASTDFDSRRRCRAVHMLYYLAAEPDDEAYATIIELADELIISVIRAIAREYNEGSMGCLSSLESLALSRYRKSIDKLADYANSMKRTRETLLKPHKRRRHVPESVEYVPMLLTLALTKRGLAKYVDDFDESIDLDDDSEESENGDDIQDDDNEDGEAEPEDESESEAGPEDSDEADDQEAEADSEEIEEGADEQAEPDSQEREECDNEEAESGFEESEEGDDQETESGSEISEEGDNEETESGSEESAEGDDEETESGSEKSEEGDDEEGESGSEESEDAEPDESEELDSEESEEDESEEVEEEESEAESEDKDHADQQPAKNLKRPHAELSTIDEWVKRSRHY
jgi:hypothetical protein